ncbi:1-acyl-sn-glycerol-3-phosphate acyltransferase [Collinsella sp. AGMB00827]|uniref:1-acyl-sn-glycerol-3-phosphate acyltransferase n=1 Tax=Collinsella ureilytica TaxID=2869515 RepID=A0ABS7MKX7_9ACTN|nr:lysophospholipid acyltransferase family protein [Collinsella urealyticum]MBY4798019.1 1-acyl-sn-glycerol-3-phosphate acyltransferase [Collinsella urealyticum]
MNNDTKQSIYDRPLKEFSLLNKVLLLLALGIVWLATKIYWRWSIDDPQQTLLRRTSDKGAIIICNHTSMAEVAVIMAHLVVSGRPVRAIGKSEFFAHPIIGWVFSHGGTIPVKRGDADMRALRRASRALGRGEDILIFPEGTRLRTDAAEREAVDHGGFALIAQMADVAVIPMAVCGFRDITPIGSRFPRPRRCWMRVGTPLSLQDAPSDLRRRDRLDWLGVEGMRRVRALRDNLRSDHPGRK